MTEYECRSHCAGRIARLVPAVRERRDEMKQQRMDQTEPLTSSAQPHGNVWSVRFYTKVID